MSTMKELAALPHNALCADCGSGESDWTSINLGVFLCIRCAGIHRNLGVHHSKVRSIDLDTSCWDEETVAFMRSVGNDRARAVYEHLSPSFYLRPQSVSDSPIVRENWIRAKYVRKEFVKAVDDDAKDGENPSLFYMPERAREGELDKLNPKNVWQRRWFVLHRRTLSYFKEGSDSYFKGEIDVTQATIVVPDQPDAARPYTFELHTAKKVYPLAAQSAESMFDWIHALRRARHYYLEVAPDGAGAGPAPEVNSKGVTYRELKPRELRGGELTKQGGHFKSWNRRWCVVADGALYYFKAKPMNDDTPEGGLSLAECDVSDAEARTGKRHCFSIITPGRVYFFIADTARECTDWMATIRAEIERLTPRTPVDFRVDPTKPPAAQA